MSREMSSILRARLGWRLPQLGGRGCANQNVRPAFYRLKKNQKRFSQDDGVPVHLKAGLRDRILFKTTWGLVLLGIAMSLKLAIWDLSVEKWLKTF